ncbi:hypothetical protein KT71_002076 [Congregibacter litoralis KT71]|uniref:Uncharacterized protein n=1 Tax=Congregibacter litoralis KT71 TaxID=314285 RepID=V7HT58_9GAMM|nr:hypothetical protein KT71_002076 [Congregibacter litoralis KT71]
MLDLKSDGLCLQAVALRVLCLSSPRSLSEKQSYYFFVVLCPINQDYETTYGQTSIR